MKKWQIVKPSLVWCYGLLRSQAKHLAVLFAWPSPYLRCQKHIKKNSWPRASAQRDGRPEPQPSSLDFKWSNKQAGKRRKQRKTTRMSQHLEVDLARSSMYNNKILYIARRFEESWESWPCRTWLFVGFIHAQRDHPTKPPFSFKHP